MTYNAFLSYSHAQDSDLAPHLETALEKFAKPLFKQRALNIFRDANDLSASPDLWGKIEEGLKNSEYFIFLASPRAAQSRWCKKEVEFWKANKSIKNFLVVLTDGEIAWSEATSDFDWTKTTAIPDNLSGAFVNEPLYVDFRNHNNTELGLEYPDFKTNTVLLAATIHGKTVGNMIGENIKQHKKTIRIRNGVIGILTALLIAVGGSAYYANTKKVEAESQTKIAKEQTIEAEQQKEKATLQANRALATKYLSDSKASYEIDPTISLRLAEYAYRFAKYHNLELSDFEDQLIKTYYNPSNFHLVYNNIRIVNDSNFEQKEYQKNKLHINEQNELVLTDPSKKRTIFSNPSWFGPPNYFSFSPNGKFIIVENNRIAGSALSAQYGLGVYDLTGRKIASVWSFTLSGLIIKNKVHFSTNEDRFIINGQYDGAFLYDTTSITSKSIMLHKESTDIIDISISNDGNQVALANRNGIVEVFSINPLRLKIQAQWNLLGHNLEVIDEVTYGDKDQYLFSKSVNLKRKWSVKNYVSSKTIRLSKAVNAYEIQENPDILTLDNEGKLNFIYTSDMGEGLHITYMNRQGDTIAKFIPNENSDYLKKWVSMDKRYYATRNGLFNSSDELLIRYKENSKTYRHSLAIMSFSNNSKFFFLVDKCYILDPELILKRINDDSLLGPIYQFNNEDKLKYQIQDLN